MIKKLWVTIANNKLASTGFVFVSYVLVLTYHAEQWFWVLFFTASLASYIFQLAKTSATYDVMKRKGDV